jgi:DNA-binding MurR/RpiR family transcriptional regulator
MLHMNQDSDENTTEVALAGRLGAVSGSSERVVAEYLLGLGSRAAAMSAREVASATGTSDATVVRTARSLGFEGFRELKRFLAGQADEAPLNERLRATLSDTRDPDDELDAACDRQRVALEGMTRGIPKSQFHAANRIIAAAEHVWWSGIGPSAFLAEYAAFLFRRLGKSSGALTHSGFENADELLSIRQGDVVVVLAYGRLHRHVRVLLEWAAEEGVEVVLITDSLVVRSEWPIAVRLASGRGPAGMFSSHGTTILVIEALALAMAAAHPDRAQASVDRLNQLRSEIAGRPFEVSL